jgi:Uri superfamily endonuclease
MHRRVVTIIGDRFQRGAYVLRIGVEEPLQVVFGHFHGGGAIAVPCGTYLYLGSAMGHHGAASLARRLLRHSARSQGHASHAIQQTLIRRFRQVGLGPPSLHGPVKKTPFWHVDYLLEETAVRLEAVFVLRSDKRLEAELAPWFENHRCTSILRTGLGATDAPGATHLLQLRGGEAAWNTLLHEARNFLTQTTKVEYREEPWDD